MSEASREQVEYALRGKTLTVYLYLLRHGKAIGVREIQKALGFSSPSVAFHHLDKLVELGVVEKDQYERYVLAKKVDTGILHSFVSIGVSLSPGWGSTQHSSRPSRLLTCRSTGDPLTSTLSSALWAELVSSGSKHGVCGGVNRSEN